MMRKDGNSAAGLMSGQEWNERSSTKTLGWRPSCSCIGAADMVPRPGRVLDPFCGSSRTGVEALRLGLDFTGIDLSPEYCELSRKLLMAENPLFSGLT